MFTEDSAKKKQGFRIAALLILVSTILIISNLVCPAGPFSAAAQAQSQKRQKKRQPAAAASKKPPRIDYSRFTHVTHVTTQKLTCDACHKFPTANWKDVRQADAAFPDVVEYPQHATCFTCHRKQFFDGPRPAICTNCHVAVTPRDTTRYPFPSLGESFFASKKGTDFVSDFSIYFSHEIHIEVVSQIHPFKEPSTRVRFITASLAQEKAPPADASCKVCHQTYQPQGDSPDEYVTKPPKNLDEDAFWLKKGAFKTVPMTHTVCFSCHSEDSGLTPAPTDCNACHKLSKMDASTHIDFDPKLAATMGIKDNITLMKWRKRESGVFRHEWFSHAELSCLSCHNAVAIDTLDEKTKKVPIKSCGGGGEGCHITPTTDDGGILNYVIEQRKANPAFQCRKCHVVFGKEPIPQSHLDAVEALKRK